MANSSMAKKRLMQDAMNSKHPHNESICRAVNGVLMFFLQFGQSYVPKSTTTITFS